MRYKGSRGGRPHLTAFQIKEKIGPAFLDHLKVHNLPSDINAHLVDEMAERLARKSRLGNATLTNAGQWRKSETNNMPRRIQTSKKPRAITSLQKTLKKAPLKAIAEIVRMDPQRLSESQKKILLRTFQAREITAASYALNAAGISKAGNKRLLAAVQKNARQIAKLHYEIHFTRKKSAEEKKLLKTANGLVGQAQKIVEEAKGLCAEDSFEKAYFWFIDRSIDIIYKQGAQHKK